MGLFRRQFTNEFKHVPTQSGPQDVARVPHFGLAAFVIFMKESQE
jgi:hypothetical protein